MKNLYLITVLFTLLIIPISNAQNKLKGNKEVTTENRNISDFSKIEVLDNVNVELIYNLNQGVRVKTDSNLQNAILTNVKNGVLIISTNAKITRKKELTIFIKVNTSLKEIYAYKNSNLKSENILNIDSLTINAFDNADFSLKLNSKLVRLNTKKTSDTKLELVCEDLFITAEENSGIKATINSTNTFISSLDKSSVNISGSTNKINLEISGNSIFKGRNYTCESATVKASNNSDAYINASESITISAINSSEVYIYSNPKIILTEFFDKASIHKKILDKKLF